MLPQQGLQGLHIPPLALPAAGVSSTFVVALVLQTGRRRPWRPRQRGSRRAAAAAANAAPAPNSAALIAEAIFTAQGLALRCSALGLELQGRDTGESQQQAPMFAIRDLV